MLPTDLLYIKLGVQNTVVRLPRLLKYGEFGEFFTRVDAKIRHYQYVLRLVKTVLYMLFLIHLNACAYFAISYYEGIGSNSFVYDGVGNAYFRCFYFATKTATSIGEGKLVSGLFDGLLNFREEQQTPKQGRDCLHDM